MKEYIPVFLILIGSIMTIVSLILTKLPFLFAIGILLVGFGCAKIYLYKEESYI